MFQVEEGCDEPYGENTWVRSGMSYSTVGHEYIKQGVFKTKPTHKQEYVSIGKQKYNQRLIGINTVFP